LARQIGHVGIGHGDADALSGVASGAEAEAGRNRDDQDKPKRVAPLKSAICHLKSDGHVEDKLTAAKTHIGKAVVGCGHPDAILFFFECLVDSLLHFLGDLDHVVSTPLQSFLWGSAAAVKRFGQRWRVT